MVCESTMGVSECCVRESEKGSKCIIEFMIRKQVIVLPHSPGYYLLRFEFHPIKWRKQPEFSLQMAANTLFPFTLSSFKKNSTFETVI
jgi:hypothetical protein